MKVDSIMSTLFEKSHKPKAVEEFLDFYFYRRVANLFIPLFLKFKIAPNTVTLLSLVWGLVGAYCVYHHQYVLSVFLLFMSIIFDCADGQLARLTGSSGPLGRVLDGLVDLVVVVAVWNAIYLGGTLGEDPSYFKLTALLFAGLSMILHCWRYDNVKIKSLELVETSYKETDLDVHEALALAKKEWKALRVFTAVLAVLMAVQMYFFVRGNQSKTEKQISDETRKKIRERLEPEMRFWSWLGIGHHNTLVLIGLLMGSWSATGLWFAFFMIAVPMNVWFVYGEMSFYRAYKTVHTTYLT